MQLPDNAQLVLVGAAYGILFGLIASPIGFLIEKKFQRIWDARIMGIQHRKYYGRRTPKMSKDEDLAWRADVLVTTLWLYRWLFRRNDPEHFGYKFSVLVGLLAFLVFLLIVFV